MKTILLCLLALSTLLPHRAWSQDAVQPQVPLTGRQQPQFSTAADRQHPSIGYWFITPEILQGDTALKQLEQIRRATPYDLIFLTARNGVDFLDTEQMHPFLRRVVQKADSLGLRIGLQVWASRRFTEEGCSRSIIEHEGELDARGETVLSGRPYNIRLATPFKKELFRVYAFRKSGEGLYRPGTLVDLTSRSRLTDEGGTFRIEVHGGKSLRGYTVYALTQVYYEWPSLFDDATQSAYRTVLQAYADIPFKGIGLDEFGYIHVKADTVDTTGRLLFRMRHYSLAMKTAYADRYGRNLDDDLFTMRYVANGQEKERIRAINFYMDLMRHGPLRVEETVAREARRLYGPDVFLGLHDTFHNNMDRDEIWSTGVNWWTLPRDYGHSDEETLPAIQTGIGMACAQPVMYNMYYHRDLEHFAEKALTDLRYGIRTHYHALNDRGRWGVDLAEELPALLMGRVEQMSRLLNRFGATYANARILVVAGMEALCNWYPDTALRSPFDLRAGLDFERKSQALWQAGYLHALVPTDLIERDLLTLDAEGRPTLNGHTFDALVVIGPQYAKPKTLDLLTRYARTGRPLIVDGTATRDFYGADLTDWYRHIKPHLLATDCTPESLRLTGIAPEQRTDGVTDRQGAAILTDYPSLRHGTRTPFSIRIGGHTFSGEYQGLVAIDADADGRLRRFACGACDRLLRDGEVIYQSDTPAHLLYLDGRWEVLSTPSVNN